MRLYTKPTPEWVAQVYFIASAVIKSAAHYYRPYPTRPLVHVV